MFKIIFKVTSIKTWSMRKSKNRGIQKFLTYPFDLRKEEHVRKPMNPKFQSSACYI